MLLFPTWLSALAACTTVTTALKLSTIRKNVPNSSLTRRFSKNATSSLDDPFDFKIHQDVLYTTTLQINGQLFQVNMDTGSSDLFLDTTGANLDGAINTGQLGSLTYGDLSQARGNLTLIDVTWGNYTVKNQIFINAPGTNATAVGTDGLLGLGPPSLSTISAIVDHLNMTVNGNAMLQNIFNLEPDKADFITFRLTRNVAGVSDGGDFTIGEVVPGYEQVLSTPKLPIYGDRWLTFMDALIVNGKRVTAPSLGYEGVHVPEGKMTAIFDTGVQYNIAPKFFVDALFKDVPGAVDMGEAYAVPCDTKLNVSLAFGDMEYPIHPVDLVTPAEMNNSEVVCIGAILSLTNGVGGIGDFQLGDVVMRNTYTLFDYGNWTRPGDTQPFVQLLNLTNADQAWSEFDSMQTKRINEYFAANFNLSSFTHSDSETQTSTAMTSSAATSNIVSTTLLTEQASSLSITSSSSRAAPTSKDLAAGALSHNEANDLGDLNDLIRNSYIVMGLLAFVLVLLVVVLVTSLMMKKKVPRARTWENKEMVQPLNDQETFSGPSGRYSD